MQFLGKDCDHTSLWWYEDVLGIVGEKREKYRLI